MINKILLILIFALSVVLNVYADGNEPYKNLKTKVPMEVDLFINNYWQAIKKDNFDLISKEPSFIQKVMRDAVKFKKIKNDFTVQYTHFSPWKNSKNIEKYSIAFNLIDKKTKAVIEDTGCYILTRKKINYKFERYEAHCLSD